MTMYLTKCRAFTVVLSVSEGIVVRIWLHNSNFGGVSYGGKDALMKLIVYYDDHCRIGTI